MRIHNITFKSRIVYENSKTNLSASQKEYLDKFEEGRIFDLKFLGEGVTSKAYYSQSQDFVIKQNKYNPYVTEKTRGEMGSLSHENDILFMIDDHIKTSQKAVGYVETEKGSKFLLSTFVSGSPANRWTNPFQDKHIDRLIRNLYRLDKAKIIHCDLSRPNLLLNSNFDVNIIDYQWGEQFDALHPYQNYYLNNSFFPVFEMPNNATMFEAAGLAGYLKEFNSHDAEILLSKYLKNKAVYTEKKYNRLKQFYSNYPGCYEQYSEFEKAKTDAYTYQDSAIRTAELLKINILNCHRRQYSCYDINKIKPRNMLKAIPLMIKAKQFADNLSILQTNYSCDKKYFDYMNKYGKFWQEKFSTWYPQTIVWLFKVYTGIAEPKGKIIFPEKFDDFSGLNTVNIENNISMKEQSFFEKIFAWDEMAEAKKRLKEIFKNAYNSKTAYYNNYSELNKIVNKIFRVKT